MGFNEQKKKKKRIQYCTIKILKIKYCINVTVLYCTREVMAITSQYSTINLKRQRKYIPLSL